MFQETFDGAQTQVGRRDVERRPVVEIPTGGVQHWGVERGGVNICVERSRTVPRTSGLGGFEQNPDQLGDIEVGGVVERVHVGPSAPQAHVGTQRDQL